MMTLQLVNDNGNQIVTLPPELGLGTDKVVATRVGDSLLLIPAESSWRPLIESLDGFTDDFMRERIQPSQAPREEAFE